MDRKQEYCASCRVASRRKNEKNDCRVCSARCPDIEPDERRLFECFVLCSAKRTESGIDWPAAELLARSMNIVTDEYFFRCLGAMEAALNNKEA